MIELNGIKLYKISEVAKILHIGRATVYALLKKKVFESKVIGRTRYIPENSLKNYLGKTNSQLKLRRKNES